jgi:hypothetical protein
MMGEMFSNVATSAGDLFWGASTSALALGADGLILLAALCVGFLPFARFLPVVGPYVPAAKLVAVLAAALICFKLGFRIASEREEAKSLRATIAAQRADLDNAAKSAANANLRASSIEKEANAQRKADDETISKLNLAAGCGFEPFPGRVHDDAGAGASAGGARSAGETGPADDVAGSAGAGSDVPVSVVRRRWLPWQRP